MSQLLEALNRIAELSPDAIKPGVTTEQIDEYLRYYYDVNFKLPEEFYQFYQYSDGLYTNFGLIFNMWRAIGYYSEAREKIGYYSAWFPINFDEEYFNFVRGEFSSNETTAPIIQIHYADLLENNDWKPKIVYSSLTEMIIDIADEIEYPYG